MKVDKSAMTAGQKAAHTRKWRRAAQLAHQSGQSAKKFTKHLLAQHGYRYLSLDSRKGYEYKGIVDLVAVKRQKRIPDMLTIVLFQVKGGSARLKKEEIARLRDAVRRIKVEWNVAHRPRRSVKFRRPID